MSNSNQAGFAPKTPDLNASPRVPTSDNTQSTPVTNARSVSTQNQNVFSPSVSSPLVNQSTPNSSHQQSRQTGTQSSLPPRDLFGNSPGSVPSPISDENVDQLPVLLWNGFRILADRTLIDWLQKSTIVDLSNDPEIEKAIIKANTIFEFCEMVKCLAKPGERIIMGFGEELVLNNYFHPDKFGVVMLDLVNWLVDKTKIGQLIIFSIPPDLNRMRNSAYMNCLRQISGKIWGARSGRPQVLVFDTFKTISTSVAFQLPDQRNLTDRERRLIAPKPKIFSEDECRLLDGQVASFIKKVADVKYAQSLESTPIPEITPSGSSTTNAVSGSGIAPGSSAVSTSSNSKQEILAMLGGHPDPFDSEMRNLISEQEGVTIEDASDEDLNVNFFADDPFFKEEEFEGYEDWSYSSVMDEQAYEDRVCEDPRNYYINTSGQSDYDFLNSQDQNEDEFHDASDHCDPSVSTPPTGNEYWQ